MAYTRDDYLKDLLIVNLREGTPERADAKFRVELFELGQLDKIESAYPEFATATTSSPQGSDSPSFPIDDDWNNPAVFECARNLFDGDVDTALDFLDFMKKQVSSYPGEREAEVINRVGQVAACARLGFADQCEDQSKVLQELFAQYKERFTSHKARGISRGKKWWTLIKTVLVAIPTVFCLLGMLSSCDTAKGDPSVTSLAGGFIDFIDGTLGVVVFGALFLGLLAALIVCVLELLAVMTAKKSNDR